MSNDQENRIVFETFAPPESIYTDGIHWSEPTSHCGVHVQRYSVTIELIEDPKEILLERLRTLFNGETHSHRQESLRREAIRLGIDPAALELQP